MNADKSRSENSSSCVDPGKLKYILNAVIYKYIVKVIKALFKPQLDISADRKDVLLLHCNREHCISARRNSTALESNVGNDSQWCNRPIRQMGARHRNIEWIFELCHLYVSGTSRLAVVGCMMHTCNSKCDRDGSIKSWSLQNKCSLEILSHQDKLQIQPHTKQEYKRWAENNNQQCA